MKAVATALLALFVVVPAAGSAAAQSGGYPDQARSWSSYSRYGNDYNGQADRPGDYRCDAYWDRARDDCDARWRDQRPFVRTYSSAPRRDRPHHGTNAEGGGYVYQPYNQGTQYYGAYGRPDQVYPGSGYGGRQSGYYGAGQPYGGQYGGGQYSGGEYGGTQYGEGQRDPNRSAWCASQYRSYDPVSGYYRAYSGRLVFCG